MKKLFFPLFIFTTIFISCDKIDDPIPDDFVSIEGIIWDDSLYTESSPTMRKIVLEEFTGQKCTYCPDGAREIARLDSIYTNQFIPISIHAGIFADPNGSGAPNDFRTTAGNDFYIAAGSPGLPGGIVSRLNNATTSAISQWEIDLNSIKNDVPKVSIGLSTLYDDSTRTLKTVVSTKWLATQTGNFNLQVYLLEDSIVAYQLDNSVAIPNYMHRHMLRKGVNGSFGTPIPSSNIGDIDTQEFATEINPSWNKDNCIVVVHVYKASPNYEIIQGEELHIVGSH
jgi:hypothetical protein